MQNTLCVFKNTKKYRGVQNTLCVAKRFTEECKYAVGRPTGECDIPVVSAAFAVPLVVSFYSVYGIPQFWPAVIG